MDAIRKQDDKHLAVGIDPKRRAGKSRVPVGALTEVLAASGTAITGVPPKGAMTGGASGELCHGAVGHNAHSVVLPSFKEHLGKHGEIRGGAEQASVSGNASECPCVLVVDFAAQGIAARRRDFGGCRTGNVGEGQSVVGVGHTEFREHVEFEKNVQALATHRFGDKSQNVGAQIGVFVTVARDAVNRR